MWDTNLGICEFCKKNKGTDILQVQYADGTIKKFIACDECKNNIKLFDELEFKDGKV